MGQRFRSARSAAFPHTEQSMMIAYSLTIHYISTLPFPESPSRNCACEFAGSAPRKGGASFLIVLVRALFPVLGRFCIYNGRFPVRRNEQEPQEERAGM